MAIGAIHIRSVVRHKYVQIVDAQLKFYLKRT